MKRAFTPRQEKLTPSPRGLNWWVFFWSSVVFIVYGSFFPFNFQSEAKPIDLFYATWHMFENTSDAVDNFLLFLPLGIGLDACFRGALKRWLAALTALLLLGVVVQLIQLYLPSRTASISDVLWNAIGMGVGMVGFKKIRQAIEHRQGLHTGSHDNYAAALVVVWFLYESFPFVPTLDVGMLREHFKTAIIAPPFEGMRLLQHTLAGILGGVAVLRANWIQPRWLNLLFVCGLAVFFEVFAVYGSLRRETLAGIGLGLLLGYWFHAKLPRSIPVILIVVAISALLISVLTPYRGQPVGSTFTLTPFSHLLWRGATKDIAPTAFEGLAIGTLFWVGVLLHQSLRMRPARWIGGVLAMLVPMELFRVYVVGYHGDTTPLALGVVLASFFLSFERAPPDTFLNRSTPIYPTPKAKTPLRPFAMGYCTHLVFIGVMAIVFGVVFHLPGIPYNVRELLAPGLDGVGTVTGLAITVYGMANGIFWLFGSKRQKLLLAFPALLLGHGVVTWFVLKNSVPIESLFDIVGSPVLGWPWDWELMGRYSALHLAVMMQILGAALCVRAIARPATLANLIYWLVINVLLAWPLFQVVVQWAGTDNLTELMANSADFSAASMLAVAFFLTCFAGSAVSAVLAGSRRVKTLVASAAVASVGAALLYWSGSEHTILKYGRVFSAFQFLLSTDRAHYVQGSELFFRFVFTYFTVVVGLMSLQLLLWKQELQGRIK